MPGAVSVKTPVPPVQKSTPISPFSFSLLNITLVLFFMGVFALVATGLDIVVETAKTEQGYKVVLADHVSESKGAAMAKEISEAPYASSARYVSKDEAFKIMREREADEFGSEVMDEHNNPYPAVVEVVLRPAYTNVDSVNRLTVKFRKNTDVQDIKYPLLAIQKVNERASGARMVAMGLGAVLLLVAFLLVRNTVRLAIFSRRMVIRAMQLVGATEAFIRKPFLRLGLVQGLVGGLLAVGLLIGLVALLDNLAGAMDLNIPLLTVLENLNMQVIFLGIIAFGGLIGYLSSLSAVNRFLGKQLDQIA